MGNELSLMSSFHLREWKSTSYDIFLTSSHSPLQINEKETISVCLAQALWHMIFQSLSTKIGFHSPVTVSYSWLLIDFAAVIHLPLAQKEKDFKWRRMRGEGGWLSRTAVAAPSCKSITSSVLHALHQGRCYLTCYPTQNLQQFCK